MPVRTTPWQPVIYDSMLLADAVLQLRRLGHTRRDSNRFCEHEKNLVVALTRIRNLAQFLSATGKQSENLIKVTDPDFGGTADTRFIKGAFDVISKYVSHLSEQRYKKEPKYPQPKARDACEAAREMIPTVKAVLDSIRTKFSGDAETWYNVFVAKTAEFETTWSDT